jgi:hypothetical protein
LRHTEQSAWRISGQTAVKGLAATKVVSTNGFCAIYVLKLMSRAAGLTTFAGDAMVAISEELKAAKAAKAAIKLLLTATPKSVVSATLRKANHAAILNLSSGGALNEARANVGVALSGLVNSMPTPEKIDKAKGAVEEWINQLRS